ncbi:MAG: histidine kinase [Verrucomicrobiota bacterium]
MVFGMRSCFIVAGYFLSIAGNGFAAPPLQAYGADSATLHLWHFDEAAPPFKDWGNTPTSLRGLLNGAEAGKASLKNFGSSVSFVRKPGDELGAQLPYGPILLAKPELSLDLKDNLDAPFPIMGKDGAFTMEAVVKLDMLPSDSPGLACDIVSMDDDDRNNRVFIFRIEKPGFLSFIQISGDSVQGGGLATIPTSGPHAINTRDWFHVAVTYAGNENVPDNLKLYWTRIGSETTAANPIGRGTLTADLSRELGDFAIGNSGKFNPQGPLEFFPGCIDEVRLSEIARHPHDFFFVSPESKKQAEALLARKSLEPPKAELKLQRVLVDDIPITQSVNSPLTLPPGPHRLDFDFGFPAEVPADPLTVKCRLEGLDEDWHPTAQGMTLTLEMLGENEAMLGRTSFSSTRSSPGWQSDILNSPWVKRTEPLFVPEATRRIRAVMSSGAPDTTGCWVIDDLSLTRSSKREVNLWQNGDFGTGERVDQIGGVPTGWTRGGSEPAIARVMLGTSPGLGFLDAAQNHSASWTCTQNLSVVPAPGGEVFLLGWSEAYNVIPGASLRATYTNVPSGKFSFRAIAVADKPVARTAHLVFPIVISQPFWKQVWFTPLMIAMGVGVIACLLFLNYRRRLRRRLAAIRLASAVERDRTRIARDMHDDLGTRVSLMKHAASVVRESIGGEPDKTRQQALRLESAASDLVRAMDGLVWAVNPANDSLDHLASHLSGVAQEIFRDAPVTLRISIPTDLPALSIRSDFRNHFSLAVKEALHNILKHSGECVASLQLTLDGLYLTAVINDSGAGFDTANPKAGNGLSNLDSRARDMGGTCEIQSSPGKGTRVVLRCPLPKLHHS